MQQILSIITFCFLFFFSFNHNGTNIEKQTSSKSRVVLLTDILNEPDDSQTLVHFLMYANKMDIEGIIAVSSCHQYKGKNDPNPLRNTVHPNEVRKFVEAYGKVRSNLLLHEKGWPTKESLLSIVGAGPEGFGTRDIGEGKTTTGSKILANAIKKKSDRPLYVIVNAGANCLAQALIDLRGEMSREELDDLLKNVRICDNAGQDNAGAWIAHNFPKLHYKRSSQQVYNFMNNEGPVTWDSSLYAGQGQHAWAKENIQTHHGPLGDIYPTRMKWKDPTTFSTIEGGGSGNFIGFVNLGLYDPEHINWGGWGGRFDTIREENIYANQLKWAEPELFDSEKEYQPYFMFPQARDKWTDPETGKIYQGIGVPIFRWRRAYQNDFQARMDWCVKPFKEANHNPVAAFNNDISDEIVFLNAQPGDEIVLDATKSIDADSDSIAFQWYNYPEAGNYPRQLEAINPNLSKTSLRIPEDADGKQIHFILEICDRNKIVSLYDYRRIVINVEKHKL
jgi:hypothetical protein